MTPNKCSNFIDKYGRWWYLREFDYLPELLEYYPHNIANPKDFFAYAKSGLFELFRTKEEAEEASYQIRKLRNIEPYSFNKELLEKHKNDILL